MRTSRSASLLVKVTCGLRVKCSTSFRPILKTPQEVDGIGLGGASGPAVGRLRRVELPSALKHGLVARAQVLDLRAGKPLRMESGGFEGFTEQPDHCFRPILLTELSLKGQFAQQVRVAEGVGTFEFCITPKSCN